MNKIFRKGYTALLAVAVMASMAACTDEYEYDGVGVVDNHGAYLSADQTSLFLTEFDEQKLSFTVSRHDTVDAASYRLYTTNDGIDIPSEVSFAAGEKSKKIEVEFNVPVGTIEDSVVIGVQDEDAYMYGAHSLTFVISRCELLTGGMMYSALFGGYWPIDIFLYGHTETTNADGTKSSTSRYMLKDPCYGTEHSDNPAETVDPLGLGELAQNHNIIFNLSSNGKAVLTSSNQSLFYCDATVSGNAEAVGDVLISGDGTYYKDETMVDATYNFRAANFILFPWEFRIGNTGWGFGTVINAVLFPGNFDPITQKITGE